MNAKDCSPSPLALPLRMIAFTRDESYHLFSTGLKAFPCNVSLLSTIVTRLVPGRLGAIGRDMSRLSTIETTAERVLLPHDRLPRLSLGLLVGTIACDMPPLAAVVTITRSVGFGTVAASTTTTAASTLLWGLLRAYRRGLSRCRGLGFFLGHD